MIYNSPWLRSTMWRWFFYRQSWKLELGSRGISLKMMPGAPLQACLDIARTTCWAWCAEPWSPSMGKINFFLLSVVETNGDITVTIRCLVLPFEVETNRPYPPYGNIMITVPLCVLYVYSCISQRPGDGGSSVASSHRVRERLCTP